MPVALCSALAVLLCCGGCLQRRIVVTSEPSGAVVWINDQEVGRTPVETGFTFYGVYDVRVHKEGFEPVGEARKAKAPWYEYPGPDLVASAMPFRIRKTVRWHFDLVPLPPDDEGSRGALV
ncbi:MAG: PEGA domain-containing protein, partial [Gemmatimonadales bacterium]